MYACALLEGVGCCEPIGHRHALTLHTNRHYLTVYVLCRSFVFALCGLGDRLRPLLGSVEWYDLVELGIFPRWDGVE